MFSTGVSKNPADTGHARKLQGIPMSTSHNTDPFDNDSVEDVVLTSHDWESDESFAMTIISAVGRLADREPEKLEPLYNYVDTESLDSLFKRRDKDEQHAKGCLTLTFDEYEVNAYSSGVVLVRWADSP